jgi:bacterial/archaeal transporter family-2 protein
VDKGAVAGLATVAVGGLVALQAPINSTLGKSIGSIAAASVNFTVGLVLLVLITLLFAGGYGDLSDGRGLAWYYWIGGGIAGAAYVTTVLFAVRELGAGGVTAATITGQLGASLVIDRLGVLGLEETPITAWRVVGVVLLAVGTVLIVR